MRCDRCKASCEECHAESNEIDWYCAAGFPEEERDEDKNGDLGCPLHWKTIEWRMKEYEKAWLKDKEEQLKWLAERKARTNK